MMLRPLLIKAFFFTALALWVLRALIIDPLLIHRLEKTFNDKAGKDQFATFSNVMSKVYANSGPNGLKAFNDLKQYADIIQFDWWLVDQHAAVITQGQNRSLSEIEARHAVSVPAEQVLGHRPLGQFFYSGPLPGHANLWLVMERQKGKLNPWANWRVGLVVANFVWFLASILLVLGCLYFYLSRKAEQAREVLKRLKSGDLGARFKIQKADEISGLMGEFNHMAEEIDKTMSQLRKTEATKIELAQELGHDLRGPIMSVQVLLETLEDFGDRMPPSERASAVKKALGELRYLIELLDELIAITKRTSVAPLTSTTKTLSVRPLLESEIQAVLAMPGRDLAINLTFSDDCPTTFPGDEKLIRRMLRNIIQNARRYAKSRIDILVARADSGRISIRIRDDGEGLTEGTVQTFGSRKAARSVDSVTSADSLGLGSVIAVSIAQLHGGTLKIRNRTDQGTSGAEIDIELPCQPNAPLSQAA